MSATRVAKQTFFNFLTIGFNAFTSLVVTAVIARFLGPATMGTYSLVTWFFTIAGIFVNLGLVTTTMKYMAEALGRDDREEAGAVLAHGLRQLLVNGAVVTVAWLALSPVIAHFYGHSDLLYYLWVASLAILPASAMALLTAACQGIQRYDQVAVATGAYTLAMAGGTATVLALGGGVAGLLAVMAGSGLVACALYMRTLAAWAPGWHRHELASDRRRVLKGYGGSLMILILLDAIVWQRSGVFFLGMWAPAAEVGFYALAFGLATMAMRMIPGTLVGLLIPSMSRSFGAGAIDEVRRIYQAAGRWMAILAMPVAVGGTVLAPALVTVMYGPEYLPMAPLLGVLFAAGALVMTFGFPASSVLYAMEGQRFLIKTGLGVGALNIALAVWLIPSLGAMGAALATAVSQVASLVPGAYFAGRMLGGTRPAARKLPLVLAAALGMGLAVWAIAQFLPPVWALLVGVPVGGVVYALNLWLLQALEPEDWDKVKAVASRLPGARRIGLAGV